MLRRSHPTLGEGAQEQFLDFADLPSEVRADVEETRLKCSEGTEGKLKPSFPMEGIDIVGLDVGKGIVVNNWLVCGGPGPSPAGYGCSNRGCDLTIWRDQGKLGWQRMFREHTHGPPFLSVTPEGKLSAVVVSIQAENPQCLPKPNVQYTSGMSCDVLARYKNGQWQWERLN